MYLLLCIPFKTTWKTLVCRLEPTTASSLPSENLNYKPERAIGNVLNILGILCRWFYREGWIAIGVTLPLGVHSCPRECTSEVKAKNSEERGRSLGRHETELAPTAGAGRTKTQGANGWWRYIVRKCVSEQVQGSSAFRKSTFCLFAFTKNLQSYLRSLTERSPKGMFAFMKKRWAIHVFGSGHSRGRGTKQRQCPGQAPPGNDSQHLSLRPPGLWAVSASTCALSGLLCASLSEMCPKSA